MISRAIAYHGTTQGALSITGVPGLQAGLRAAGPRLVPGAEHQLLPRAVIRRRRREGVRSVGGGPDRGGHPDGGPGHGGRGLRRAGAERRRLLPAAARLLRAAAGDLRHPRRAARLRRGDLRLRPAGHHVRRAEVRLPARHHHLRQGSHLGLLTARGGDHLRPDLRAVQQGHRRPSRTATPSAGTRCPARWRWPTWTSSSPRICSATCCATRTRSGRPWSGCYDLPIVGDVRGDGYFFGIELVKDQATKATFSTRRRASASCGTSSRTALFDRGLYCRADDRGDTVVQVAPPLISGQPEFDEIESILRSVFTDAWALL